MARLTPNFDKFELEAFKEAGHSKWKVFKWAVALLSGRYKQGKRRLEDDEGNMCCLGVLCRVNGATRKKHPEGGFTYNNSVVWIEPSEILGGNWNTTELDEYPNFAYKNDIYDVTFREIGLFLLRSLFPIRKEKDMRYEQH